MSLEGKEENVSNKQNRPAPVTLKMKSLYSLQRK